MTQLDNPMRPNPMDYVTGSLPGDGKLPVSITQPDGGGKFSPSGHVLRYPGNTFLCHVDHKSQAHEVLVELQNKIKNSPFSHRLTYLPTDSFHMTVFQGRSPYHPDKTHWPDGEPISLSRDEQVQKMCDQSKTLDFPKSHRVKIDNLYTLHSLTISGADAENEASLRAIRSKLRDITKINPPGFDRYVFHMSLAYFITFVEESEARDIMALSDELSGQLIAQMPEITLGPIELCVFDNMHHFKPVKVFA